MYNSMLLGLIQQQYAGAVESSNFAVSDNLLGGIDLHSITGEHLTSFANAAGGVTVDLGAGTADTVTMTENIYGGTTLHFTDPGIADIVGRPGLFGTETFTQAGTTVGILEPSLLTDGMTLTTDAGTLIGQAGLFETVKLKLNAFATTPTYMGDMSAVASSASAVDAVSVADSFAVVEGLDGLDLLDLL